MTCLSNLLFCYFRHILGYKQIQWSSTASKIDNRKKTFVKIEITTNGSLSPITGDKPTVNVQICAICMPILRIFELGTSVSIGRHMSLTLNFPCGVVYVAFFSPFSATKQQLTLDTLVNGVRQFRSRYQPMSDGRN